jgi:hypothetical protein
MMVWTVHRKLLATGQEAEFRVLMVNFIQHQLDRAVPSFADVWHHPWPIHRGLWGGYVGGCVTVVWMAITKTE